MESALPLRRPVSIRLAEYALVVAIFAGSLVMWLGLPVGWLWLVPHLADRYPDIYAGALFGRPVTMVLFGLLLARLNGMHLRLTGDRAPGMVVSVVIALVTMAVWYFFFAHSYTPGLPAP